MTGHLLRRPWVELQVGWRVEGQDGVGTCSNTSDLVRHTKNAIWLVAQQKLAGKMYFQNPSEPWTLAIRVI